MGQLILWNSTKYVETLAVLYSRANIVTSNTEFASVIENINAYDSLIVLCELNWMSTSILNTDMQNLQGIEIVKELRSIYSLTAPVLFVSFHSIEDIFNAEREILTAIGHTFQQLPSHPSDFTTFIETEVEFNGKRRKLSEMELNDIKSFYCSKEGILSQELHNLNIYINYTVNEDNHDVIYNNLQQAIRKINSLFLLDPANSLIDFQTVFPTITNNNIAEAVNYIVRFGNSILYQYSDSNNEKFVKNKLIRSYKWSVLLLDDQIGPEHELVKQMIFNNINIICVDNVPDAKLVLQRDWSTDNNIMVVIADYRLYENGLGVKRHQKVQGYQFLKDIATTDHLVRLVAFSGLQRKFLLNSFKYYNIRTEVKSKIDYLSNEKTIQLFCDEIIELAEDNMEVIESLPLKCAGFEKYLKDAYKELRMHPDYYKIEGNISLTSKEYVWEIQQQLTSIDELNIGAIENIKSPLAKTRKDPEAFFKRLQNYFVARRIALWLYASNKNGWLSGIDSRRIVEILTNQKYSTDAYRQVLSTNLGLSLDDFPKNITIEERRWLQYDMQLNIFRDIDNINPVFEQIAKNFKEYILRVEYLNSNFESNLKYILKYKQSNYPIFFSKDLLPEIKSVTDVRVIFLILVKLTKERGYDLLDMKPLVSKIRLLLFQSRSKVIYLKSLFQYFNSVYGLLNKEQFYINNPAKKIVDKSTFINSSTELLNISYLKAYELLIDNKLPSDADTSDTFTLFIIGEGVIKKLGKQVLNDKAIFFNELTKAINAENSLIGSTFNDNFINSDSQGDFNMGYDGDINLFS